jgi:hypothetical protein
MVIAVIIGIVALIWMWRQGAFSGLGHQLQQQPGGTTSIVNNLPGSAAAPATAPPPGGTTTPTPHKQVRTCRFSRAWH